MKLNYLVFVLVIIVSLFLIVSCGSKEEVSSESSNGEEKEEVVDYGKTVIFDYAAGFRNGSLYDTTWENAAKKAGIYNPNRVYKSERVVIGEDPLIPGLLEAMIGMKEDETKNIVILPENAYGRKIENSTFVLPKEGFENPEQLRLGQIIVVNDQHGNKVPVYLTEINEDNVTVDVNHKYAGETIQFVVLIREIQ